MILGGGRAAKDDVIDLSVGVVLSKKIGDKVNKGDVIARIYCDNADKTKEAETMIKDAYTFSREFVEKNVLIKGIVG